MYIIMAQLLGSALMCAHSFQAYSGKRPDLSDLVMLVIRCNVEIYAWAGELKRWDGLTKRIQIFKVNKACDAFGFKPNL